MKKILFALAILMTIPIFGCEDAEFNVSFGTNFNKSIEDKLLGVWKGVLREPVYTIYHGKEVMEFEEWDIDYDFTKFGEGCEICYDWETGDVISKNYFEWEVRHGGIIALMFNDGTELICKDYDLDEYHFAGSFLNTRTEDYSEFDLTYQEFK